MDNWESWNENVDSESDVILEESDGKESDGEEDGPYQDILVEEWNKEFDEDGPFGFLYKADDMPERNPVTEPKADQPRHLPNKNPEAETESISGAGQNPPSTDRMGQLIGKSVERKRLAMGNEASGGEQPCRQGQDAIQSDDEVQILHVGEPQNKIPALPPHHFLPPNNRAYPSSPHAITAGLQPPTVPLYTLGYRTFDGKPCARRLEAQNLELMEHNSGLKQVVAHEKQEILTLKSKHQSLSGDCRSARESNFQMARHNMTSERKLAAYTGIPHHIYSREYSYPNLPPPLLQPSTSTTVPTGSAPSSDRQESSMSFSQALVKWKRWKRRHRATLVIELRENIDLSSFLFDENGSQNLPQVVRKATSACNLHRFCKGQETHEARWYPEDKTYQKPWSEAHRTLVNWQNQLTKLGLIVATLDEKMSEAEWNERKEWKKDGARRGAYKKN